MLCTHHTTPLSPQVKPHLLPRPPISRRPLAKTHSRSWRARARGERLYAFPSIVIGQLRRCHTILPFGTDVPPIGRSLRARPPLCPHRATTEGSPLQRVRHSTPGPILPMRHQSGPDWIIQDIGDDALCVVVLAQDMIIETTLPQLADDTMFPR